MATACLRPSMRKTLWRVSRGLTPGRIRGDCGRGGVAHSRSLWTNRGVFEDERDRTAFDAKIWAGDTVAGCGKLLDSRVCFSSLITVQQRLRIFIGVEACVDVVTFVGSKSNSVCAGQTFDHEQRGLTFCRTICSRG